MSIFNEREHVARIQGEYEFELHKRNRLLQIARFWLETNGYPIEEIERKYKDVQELFTQLHLASMLKELAMENKDYVALAKAKIALTDLQIRFDTWFLHESTKHRKEP